MTTRITETLESFFPNEKDEVLLNPLIFGNYKNAMNSDDEIQFYEDYETYEVIHTIFESVRNI